MAKSITGEMILDRMLAVAGWKPRYLRQALQTKVNAMSATRMTKSGFEVADWDARLRGAEGICDMVLPRHRQAPSAPQTAVALEIDPKTGVMRVLVGQPKVTYSPIIGSSEPNHAERRASRVDHAAPRRVRGALGPLREGEKSPDRGVGGLEGVTPAPIVGILPARVQGSEEFHG